MSARSILVATAILLSHCIRALPQEAAPRAAEAQTYERTHADAWGRTDVRLETADSVLMPVREGTGDPDELVLRVVLEDRNYFLGEPILVHCLLINETKEAITIPYRIPSGNEDGVQFQIRGPSGEKVGLAIVFNVCFYRGPRSLTIPPQRQFVRTIDLNREFAIANPGTYDVNVEYHSEGKFFEQDPQQKKKTITKPAWAGDLNATLGKIEVRAPANRDDRNALNTLLRGLSPYDPQERYAILVSGLNREPRSRVIADFPQSRYAAFARFELTEESLRGNTKTGWRNDILARRALEQLEAMPDLDYPELFREKLLQRTILEHVGAGSPTEVLAPLVRRFRKEFPDSPYALPAAAREVAP